MTRTATKCKACGGSGEVKAADGIKNCAECEGTGTRPLVRSFNGNPDLEDNQHRSLEGCDRIGPLVG